MGQNSLGFRDDDGTRTLIQLDSFQCKYQCQQNQLGSTQSTTSNFILDNYTQRFCELENPYFILFSFCYSLWRKSSSLVDVRRSTGKDEWISLLLKKKHVKSATSGWLWLGITPTGSFKTWVLNSSHHVKKREGFKAQSNSERPNLSTRLVTSFLDTSTPSKANDTQLHRRFLHHDP